ncbi:MAG: MerR family transcriptional regulator [Deltaproteobacteria bacterium]|nr:MerR family transcriptional regulator [Deltaproteobacteria bacterium]
MLIHKELLSIGEVSQVTGLPVHTLRFWESEFSQYFSPVRTKGRQRRYTEEEVKKILEIKKLLKIDKYSIAGAKQVLSNREKRSSANGKASSQSGSLKLVHSETEKLVALEGLPSA